MNKNAIGFPSLCLGMSSVYSSAINTSLVALECISKKLYVCLVLWLYELALRLNDIAMNYWLYLLRWLLK
jgi:hypothetical protein